MDHKLPIDSEQATLWNGPSGQAWIDLQDVLDRSLQPFEDLLVDAVAAQRAQHVLDVGCGTGATTLAIARHLGARGRCVGIDISGPMIAVARSRAEHEGSRARFVCGDVQTHALEAAAYDSIVSRFGVMFFEAPGQAFANLRRAVKAEAALNCIAWRSAAENPFMTTAERAAAPLLPALPARRPDAPGQFAFADRDRVRSILQDSGWTGIDIRPIDVACAMPERDLPRYFTRLGPVGRALREADVATRARVVASLRAAFDPFVHDTDVRFTAACWMIVARAARSSATSCAAAC
ncbi:MAG TPA: class I SAM-dependent methyltransferase [Burkholderiaceae bacterium]|nr:class I SAM-dependent methyltransferase [Burkholderiaceae bacterium]